MRFFAKSESDIRRLQEDHPRIEHNHCVWNGTDAEIVAWIVEVLRHAETGDKIPSRRSAACSNPSWVYTKFCGIGPQPTHRRGPVRNRLVRRSLMTPRDTVFRRGGHHAARREVLTLWYKPFRVATHEPAAKEEHDGGPIVTRPVAFRIEDVQFQFDVVDCLIDLGH